MTTFLLILWPLVIYISYRFVLLNINHLQKNEDSK